MAEQGTSTWKEKPELIHHETQTVNEILHYRISHSISFQDELEIPASINPSPEDVNPIKELSNDHFSAHSKVILSNNIQIIFFIVRRQPMILNPSNIFDVNH
jgi:hypothetical protein